MLLSPHDALRKGLAYLGLHLQSQQRMTEKAKVEEFHAHFGSTPLVVANIWANLCDATMPEARMSEKEKSDRGFKRFMIAHCFLWVCPKNAMVHHCPNCSQHFPLFASF